MPATWLFRSVAIMGIPQGTCAWFARFGSGSDRGIVRVGTDCGRLERQHDPLAGDARRNELLRDPVLGAVVLDPHFTAEDVEVQDAAVDPIRTLPAGVHQLV